MFSNGAYRCKWSCVWGMPLCLHHSSITSCKRAAGKRGLLVREKKEELCLLVAKLKVKEKKEERTMTSGKASSYKTTFGCTQRYMESSISLAATSCVLRIFSVYLLEKIPKRSI